LSVQPSTVARHVHNLLGKRGLANRTQLAAWAHRSGLTNGASAGTTHLN
jgi:DNA-binding NarL/FixJ family response regulator